MEIINISELNYGLPTITPAYGQGLAEAAAFCLSKNSHQSSNCILNCIKTLKDDIESYQLFWDDLDPRVESTYGDLEEATEYGAMGIAILLSTKLIKYSTVERSMKGTGIDYWIGEKNNDMFQRKARLEISGIFRGNDSQFKLRLNQKFKQTTISDGLGYDCFVSIIEFSMPKASFLSKENNYGRN
jgi:hypothetical protein